jgi:Pyruvate/2-oxoacid:ferredoxin oxidoreductase delta subunit
MVSIINPRSEGLDDFKGRGICVQQCPCGAIEMIPETI